MAADPDRGTEQPQEEAQSPPADGLDRRRFLLRAAALGLSGGTLAAFLQACATGSSPTATPSGSPFPSPSPVATPTVALAATATPTSAPTATPTPSPTAMPTPSPTATATPSPTATATPSPTPRSTPTPVEPPEVDQDLLRMGHLLRRAGFGASRSELDQFMAMGLPATVDYLIDYQDVDDIELEERLASLEPDLERFGDLQVWWLLRMIYTRRPLLEKMVLFWHGLLTSSFRKVGRGPFMLDQNQLFREQALGNYGVLLKAVSRDPAMLIWLDSRSNVKSAPNENYARELMELFTMGVGHYAETDVRESARAFTGWGLRRREFVFNPFQHDSGMKTFLGRTGDFDGDDITDIILEQPAAWEFISRRLFTFFAHDDPGPETVAGLAETFRASNYSIKAVVRQILTSPEFYSARAYRAKIKSPAELVVGIVRSLGIETDGRPLRGATDTMGQSLLAPFDVSGWPGGPTWINSTTLLQRLNFANGAATARRRIFSFNPAEVLVERGISSPEGAVDYFVSFLLDGNISPEQREIMLGYVRAPQPSTTARARNLAADERLRSLVYFILASPDYQLA